MIEALLSLAVIAVLLAFVGQWSSAMMQHRRAIARRRAVMQATDNVLALAMAAEFANVTTNNLLALAQPHTPTRAQWDIRVEPTPIAGMPDAQEKKRIVVDLTFENNSHYDVRPLVAWKYPTQTRGTRDE
jgi:type II secretory pathway pseudopilin PulG